MANPTRPTLGIIGAGRVGGALARALHTKGYRIVAVWSKTPVHARALANDVGAHPAASPSEVAAAAELILLAVPDDAIAALVNAVAEAGCWRSGKAVVHLSGTHSTAILQDAAAAGALTGALHPLQTFSDGRAPVLPGTSFAIEAPEPLHATLHTMVEALNGRPLDLAPTDRPLYHAAAVMTANYAVTLMAQAVALLQHCNIEPTRALEALLPLLRGTVESLARRGLPDALTGPIVRGDIGTLRGHLEALDRHAPEVVGLYRALGAATVPIAIACGLSQERADEIENILSGSGSNVQDPR